MLSPLPGPEISLKGPDPMPNLNTPHEHIKDPAYEEVAAILRGYVEANPLTKFSVYVKDGRLCPEKVTHPEGLSGEITDQYARNVKLKSDVHELNVIHVTGKDTNYLIDGLDFELEGHGCNDFSGVGSAINAEDGAKLTIRNARVVTKGAVRPALRTAGGSEVHAYDCYFRTLGGGLTPETFTPPENTGVWFPPAPLKLDGDCRSVMTMDHGKTYYHNCTVICDNWGALATDCALGYVHLEAENCKVISEGNGYVAYADDDTHVFLKNCDIKSATVCGMQSGESDMNYLGCTAECGQNFLLIHEVLNDYQTIGLSRIVDCRIRCGGPVVLIRECSCDLYIAGCELHADNGELIHMIVSDDPNVTKLRPDETPFGAQVTMDRMSAEGDIINDITERDIILKLTETELRGALKNVVLQLYNVSKWTATADSEIVLNGPVPEGSIDALEGVVITATAGDDCQLSGSIRLPSGGLLNLN